MPPWYWLRDLLFGCRHRQRSRVFSDRQGLYQRCLDCGARLSYHGVEFAARIR